VTAVVATAVVATRAEVVIESLVVIAIISACSMLQNCVFVSSKMPGVDRLCTIGPGIFYALHRG